MDDPANAANVSGSSVNHGPYTDVYAGIDGYTTGVVEWTTVWVPVDTDAEPGHAYNTYRADDIAINNDHYPGKFGTLELTALLDGTPVPGKLLYAKSHGPDFYGTLAWDTDTGAAPVSKPFWAKFLRSKELL